MNGAIFRRSIFVILVISWSQLSEADPQVSYAGKVFIGLSGDVVSLPVDLRYASTYGLKLTRVAAGSSGEQAGLELGDVLVSIDGKAWTNDQIRLSRSWAGEAEVPQPGRSIPVLLLRQDDVGDVSRLIELDMKLRRFPRTVAEPDGGPSNAQLRPDLTELVTGHERLCRFLISACGFSGACDDLWERLDRSQRFPDPERLPIVRYVHRDPFRLERIGRELVEGMLVGAGDTDHSNIALMRCVRYVLTDFCAPGGRPSSAFNRGLPETPSYVGQDLDGHLAFVEHILARAAVAHVQAFSQIPAKDVRFVLEHRDSLLEAFLDHRVLSYDPDRDRQRANLRLLDIAGRVDVDALVRQVEWICRLIEGPFLESLQNAAAVSGRDLSAEVVARRNTPHGPILIAGRARNRHDEAAHAAIFDFGGDDIYAGPQARSVWGLIPSAVLVDYAGNDAFETHERFNQACGDLGVGVLVDLDGDDSYIGTYFTQATGFMGIGLLVDRAGNDVYRGIQLHQGVGHWGAGLLIDEEGTDSYSAHLLAQGVGLPGGLGVLCDRGREGDRYYCKGKAPSGYGTTGVFGGWGQAVGLGYRPYASGGVGVIYDAGGRDRMEAGNFSQGGGYFYGLGVLYSGGMDADHYIGSRYAQGFSAHQAAGIMIESGGDDHYTTRYAVSTGLSWDESVTLFLDEAGNDRYEGGGFSQGAAAMNGISFFVDAAGQDIYRGTDQAVASSNTYHGGTSLAFFVDAGGQEDSYPSKLNNRIVWGGEHFIFVDLSGDLSGALSNEILNASGLSRDKAEWSRSSGEAVIHR